MSEQDYLKQVKEFVNIDTSPLEDKLNDALLIFKNQLNYLSEINSLVVNTFLSTNFENLPVEISNSLTSDNFLLNIKALKNELESINEITLENAGSVVENVKIKTGLKGKDLYMPIRVAAIAKEHGPEMNKILYIVGKQKILNNINYLLR
jgi:glutamyl/glutaminyl-tRNA synthetase